MLHARQRPQFAIVDKTMWSPGRTDVTPSPTRSTTPAPSCPSAAGACQGIVPSMTETSV
jgi:hypothetical protein